MLPWTATTPLNPPLTVTWLIKFPRLINWPLIPPFDITVVAVGTVVVTPPFVLVTL
jgi:hypothetical protein